MHANEPVFTGLEYSRSSLERNRRHGKVTKSGVVYDEELAGPGGMSFVLLREPDTTEQMLEAAVVELHRNRDVVGSVKVTAVVPLEDESDRPDAPEEEMRQKEIEMQAELTGAPAP